MEKNIREQIIEKSDEEYRKFSAALLPNVDNILGVRLPELRKIARKIAKADYRTFLNADSKYFEEVMLKGMVIGYVHDDINELLHFTHDFIPLIDNWSVCDSFCSGLKFAKTNRDTVWEFIKPYFESDREYFVRFAVVMVINYFIEKDYINRVLEILNNISHDGYYAKMSVAWAISICYVKFPEETGMLLKNNDLDDFTFNKSLQKIIESRQINDETKKIIRIMKR